MILSIPDQESNQKLPSEYNLYSREHHSDWKIKQNDPGQCLNGEKEQRIPKSASNAQNIKFYAPIAQSTEQKIEPFHKQKDTIQLTKKQEINLIMGDFNT